jgi:hypothetical protein
MTDPNVTESAEAVVVPVPSGQLVRFVDVVMNAPGPDGLTARFRFVAPAIAKQTGSVDFELAAADMEHLCKSFALPRIASTGPKPSQIVISLSDRDVPFGEAAPEATQFFEAYRVDGDACIWEAF